MGHRIIVGSFAALLLASGAVVGCSKKDDAAPGTGKQAEGLTGGPGASGDHHKGERGEHEEDGGRPHREHEPK